LITREEAHLILGKWRDDRTSLSVHIQLSCGSLFSNCKMRQFDDDVFNLELPGGDAWCEFVWGVCTFDYTEPHTETDDPKLLTTAALVAMRPSSEQFTFMELRA